MSDDTTKINNVLEQLNGYEGFDGDNIWRDVITNLPGFDGIATDRVDQGAADRFIAASVLYRFEPSYGEWIAQDQASIPGHRVINEDLDHPEEDDYDEEEEAPPDEIKVVIITPDGTVTVTKIKSDLDSLRSAIGGGYLEMIRCNSAVDGWVDEEGKIKNLPANPLGTWVAHSLGWPGDGYTLAGTLMITGNRGVNVADVPDVVVAAVTGPDNWADES